MRTSVGFVSPADSCRSLSVWVAVIALALGGSAPPLTAQQPTLSGQCRASVDGVEIERPEIVTSTATEISDQCIVQGAAYAEARYSASVTRGTVGIYSGESTPGWHWASAWAYVVLDDYLSFTIRAGDYPNGLYARVSGLIHGSADVANLDCSTNASQMLQVRNQVSFGTMKAVVEFQMTPLCAESRNVVVPFQWDYPLVLPGTSLAQPQVVVVEARAELGVAASGSARGSAKGDFANTARFLSVSVPPEVTWSSASGAFLKQVSLPEPVTLSGATWKNNVVRCRFLSLPFQSYTVQYQDALNGGTWNNLTELAGTGDWLEVVDTTPDPWRRFYRVRSD